MLAPTCAHEVRAGPVQAALLTPGWPLLLAGPGAPGQALCWGTQPRLGLLGGRVDGCRCLERSRRDLEGQEGDVVSLGHVCLEVPRGPGVAIRDLVWLALGARASAFLAQEVLPRDTRLTPGAGGPPPGSLPPGPLHSAQASVTTTSKLVTLVLTSLANLQFSLKGGHPIHHPCPVFLKNTV